MDLQISSQQTSVTVRRGVTTMGIVFLSKAHSITPPQLHSQNRALSLVPSTALIKLHNHRCRSSDTTKNSTNSSSRNNVPSSSTRDLISEPQNLFLKTAWYGSELLGIAASFFRSPSTTLDNPPGKPLHRDGVGAIDRAIVVQTIKYDFERSYFVTGALTLDAYEEDCEFADPAGSFKGLLRFKRNCMNFGSLIEKSSMKLMKWEDCEDKGIGHWRFSCTMSFPWKPILSATGYTEYYFDTESGKVCRHVEHWNVPKMALFKQLLKPSRGFWGNKT